MVLSIMLSSQLILIYQATHLCICMRLENQSRIDEALLTLDSRTWLAPLNTVCLDCTDLTKDPVTECP